MITFEVTLTTPTGNTVLTIVEKSYTALWLKLDSLGFPTCKITQLKKEVSS